MYRQCYREVKYRSVLQSLLKVSVRVFQCRFYVCKGSIWPCQAKLEEWEILRSQNDNYRCNTTTPLNVERCCFIWEWIFCYPLRVIELLLGAPSWTQKCLTEDSLHPNEYDSDQFSVQQHLCVSYLMVGHWLSASIYAGKYKTSTMHTAPRHPLHPFGFIVSECRRMPFYCCLLWLSLFLSIISYLCQEYVNLILFTGVLLLCFVCLAFWIILITQLCLEACARMFCH